MIENITPPKDWHIHVAEQWIPNSTLTHGHARDLDDYQRRISRTNLAQLIAAHDPSNQPAHKDTLAATVHSAAAATLCPLPSAFLISSHPDDLDLLEEFRCLDTLEEQLKRQAQTGEVIEERAQTSQRKKEINGELNKRAVARQTENTKHQTPNKSKI